MEKFYKFVKVGPKYSPHGSEAKLYCNYKILKHMVQRCSWTYHLPSSPQALVQADTKRDGSVTRSALHKIINTLGFRISNHQMNQVWNGLASNEDGTIQYKDFLSLYTRTKSVTRRNTSKPSTARTPQKVGTQQDRRNSYQT